jgi:hypothetical protein
MTNHIWVGLHVSFNNAAWKRLPAEVQAIAYKNFSDAAIAERADWQVMDKTESDKLKVASPSTRPTPSRFRKRCANRASTLTLRSRWATRPGPCSKNMSDRSPDPQWPDGRRHCK